MKFLCQTGTKDCFPTCFCNAVRFLDIPIPPELIKRLEIFNQGTENCTIFASEERLEQYERSIHKFLAEWNWAIRHRNSGGDIHLEPEEWAKHLLEMGLHLEAKNGPVEQRVALVNALIKSQIVICEVWMPSIEIPALECKHFVLLVGLADGKLLVHDPFPTNWNIRFDPAIVNFSRHECGSNLEIDCNYFFNEAIGYMKPKPNPHHSDNGYKFLILTKQKHSEM